MSAGCLKAIRVSLVGLFLFSLNAGAAVLDFYDTSPSSHWTTSDYNGFSLTNSRVQLASSLRAPAAVSGANVLVNYNVRVGAIAKLTGVFDFTSAYFTADGRYPGATNQDVEV